KLIQSKYEFYISRDEKRALQLSKRTNEVKNIKSGVELLAGNISNDDFTRDCVVCVDRAKSDTQELGNNGAFQQDGRLDNNTSGQNREHQRQQIQSNQNQIKADNDSFRERINKRNREITRRARGYFDTIGAIIGQRKGAYQREQEFIQRTKQIRERIQREFKQIIDKVQQITRKISRGFSR
ncbi:hypothetical protein, partial [Campylobacter fetus]